MMQVVGLGMATLDILVRAADFGSGPLDGLLIEGGGMACNAAVAAQRLGAAAGFVGTCGSDHLGRLKLQLLHESGVDVSRMQLRATPEDQVVLVQVETVGGERRFHPLAAPWRQPLQPAELDLPYLTQAEFLLLDGFHLAAALHAAAAGRAAGKQVLLDANVTHGPPSAEMTELVRRSTILICSAGFCQALTGLADLPAAAARTLQLGPQIVVETDGPRGSHTFTPSENFHTPAYPLPVIDTTGAGDVFHGAYAMGLLQGWDLRRTAAFSAAAAGLKCTKFGRAGYPGLDAVYQLMEKE